MRIFSGRNVNQLFKQVSDEITKQPIEITRNGPAYVFPDPVMSIYIRPMERVLFSRHRSANPFFHLFESLWMLGGQNKSDYLDQFVSDFGSRYAEDDGVLHGAYGYRWRYHFDFDQIDVVIDRLRANPNDRRAVIQMWDSRIDLRSINDDQKKDLPCNTQIYFRVYVSHGYSFLRMTVMCRSNDVIWGAYGANAVHFSILQEYIASRLGLNIGAYYQFSNNFHVYVQPYTKITTKPLDFSDLYSQNQQGNLVVPMFREYSSHAYQDIERFLNQEKKGYKNKWFSQIAQPMLEAHKLYKLKEYKQALSVITQMQDSDWRLACLIWVNRMLKT